MWTSQCSAHSSGVSLPILMRLHNGPDQRLASRVTGLLSIKEAHKKHCPIGVHPLYSLYNLISPIMTTLLLYPRSSRP